MTMKPSVLLLRLEITEYPCFPLENGLNIRLGLNSRGQTFHTPSEEKEDYSACMLHKAEQILLRLHGLWSLYLDTNTAFLGLSLIMPNNHTDKERFAAASSCIETEILTLLFPAQTECDCENFIVVIKCKNYLENVYCVFCCTIFCCLRGRLAH